MDPVTETTEVAEFFSSHDSDLFGFTHLPRSEPHAGLVICSPLYAEFVRNYRREVLIGRLLADSGIAVQRFHYRGQGNSRGDLKSTTLQGMEKDAWIASERLREVAGVSRVAFFGTRLGALVAARVGHQYPGAPLAFWDPVLVASQYLDELERTRRIQMLKRDRPETIGLREALRRDGVAEVLGYTISDLLRHSTDTISLETSIGDSPRPILTIQLGARRALDEAVASLTARWVTQGLDAEARSIGPPEPWWFTAGALVIKEALTEPVRVTVEWFKRRLVAPERTTQRAVGK